MIDSTNPRILADNIRDLTDKQIAEAAEVVALQGSIEALGSYSETEVDTGMKYGEDTIYRKTFFIEHMPNNASVTLPHGVTNLGYVINLYGMIQAGNSNGRALAVLQYAASNIYYSTSADFSDTSGIIVFEYTKSAAPAALTSSTPDDTRSIEPEEREEEPIIDEPIEEPVVEVKKTTRKKTTTE